MLLPFLLVIGDFILEGSHPYKLCPIYGVCYIHPYPSHCLMFGSFQEACCWKRFHVLLPQKWLLSWAVGCISPGTETVAWCKPYVLESRPCTLVWLATRSPRARAVQPAKLENHLLSSSGLSGVSVLSLDLKEQWIYASTSGAGVGSKISWRQSVLPRLQLGAMKV